MASINAAEKNVETFKQLVIKPKVVVLLAAYNGELWIREQISTILSQKAVEVKIYISLDTSEDETIDIILQISEIDNRVVLLPYGEKFGSASRNAKSRLIRE